MLDPEQRQSLEIMVPLFEGIRSSALCTQLAYTTQGLKPRRIVHLAQPGIAGHHCMPALGHTQHLCWIPDGSTILTGGRRFIFGLASWAEKRGQ